jgi:FixJ family two-component response regulator
MCTILVIDDDPATMDGTGRLLQAEGLEVIWAATGAQAIRLAKDAHADIVLIDLRLPDMSGLDVLKRLRIVTPSTVCVMLSGFGDMDMSIEAMRHGAVDWLHKPLIGDDLITAVRAIEAAHVRPGGGAHSADLAFHAHARWAEVVVRAVESPKDPRTLREWGRSVGAAEGTIRNWCRTVRLPARRSLWLARILRAVIRQQQVKAPPEDLLDIVDRRTLEKVLVASGGTPDTLPPTVDDLLRSQRFIDDTKAIAVLRAALNDDCHTTGTAPPEGEH